MSLCFLAFNLIILGIGKNDFDFDLFSYKLIIFMRQNTFCAQIVFFQFWE